MWPTLIVGESDIHLDMGHDQSTMIASSLLAHPSLRDDMMKAVKIAKEAAPQQPILQIETHVFPENGDSWFDAYLGKSADEVVKDLKRARRKMKDMKVDIDSAIKSVRALKAQEVEQTISSIPWAAEHADTIRSLGLSDRNLKSLRTFGTARESTLLRACHMWEAADEALKMLDDFEDVWGDEERSAWVTAMQQRQDARKMWRSGLHQIDTLSKEQKNWLELAKKELQDKGHMGARDITANLIEKGVNRLSATRMSKLLSMFGEEMDIVKAPRRGEYVLLSCDGLVIKDPWAYAAGFMDADGSIFITKRGEVRASAVATGDRGRIHCERLQKTLGCGTLSLDEKMSKNSKRTTHRLNFHSRDDLKKVLNGVLPHLQLKSTQAKAALRFLEENDTMKKEQYRMLVMFENWKDDADAVQKKLDEWGVDADTIRSWGSDL